MLPLQHCGIERDMCIGIKVVFFESEAPVLPETSTNCSDRNHPLDCSGLSGYFSCNIMGQEGARIMNPPDLRIARSSPEPVFARSIQPAAHLECLPANRLLLI